MIDSTAEPDWWFGRVDSRRAVWHHAAKDDPRGIRTMPPPRRPAGKPRPALLALLQDARDEPHDVTRRLILADWLDDQPGEADRARAELVRLQCRLEPWPVFESYPPPEVLPEGDAERIELHRREDQLVARWAAEWLGPLAEVARECEFRRGLVRVEMAPKKLVQRQVEALAATEAWAWVEAVKLGNANVQQAEALANCVPLESVASVDVTELPWWANHLDLARTRWFTRLRELIVGHYSSTAREDLAKLADSPVCQALRSLRLRGAVPREGLGPVARADLPELRVLDLRGNQIDAKEARLLAGSRGLGGLRELRLSSGSLGPKGARALAKSRHLRELTCLDLAGNDVDDEGAAALATAPGLAQLTDLRLDINHLSGTGAARLLGSPHLRRLERLDLESNQIRGTAPLARVTWPPALRELRLSGNPLRDGGVARLAGAAAQARLTELTLANCGIGPGGVEDLAASPGLASLAVLDLSGNSLGTTGAEALARSPHLAALSTLLLFQCELGDAGLEALARSPRLRPASLDLQSNGIGPQGLEALARSALADNLAFLQVEDNPIGDQGLMALLESPRLSRLAGLVAWNCDLTDAGVEALAHCPAAARLTRLVVVGPLLTEAAAHALIRSPYLGGLRRLAIEGEGFGWKLKEALKARFGRALES
jgi:uncharacterized protein (TIGR02996 family)